MLNKLSLKNMYNRIARNFDSEVDEIFISFIKIYLK